MTDEELIASLEHLATSGVLFGWPMERAALKWLLGEYRELKADQRHWLEDDRDLNALIAENESLRADAARWRKARKQLTVREIDNAMLRMPATTDRFNIDAAVDAVIAKERADGK